VIVNALLVSAVKVDGLIGDGVNLDPSDTGFDDPLHPDTGLSGFGAFGVIFVLAFIAVVGIVLYRLVQGGAQWQQNNASPELTVAAKVVTKRQDTDGGRNDTSVRTSYFATFELLSGERLELPVPGGQFGLLAEGDQGQLTHQGTRFKGFERSVAPSVAPATPLPPNLPQDSPQDSPQD
jgi:hypothetical protein